MKLVFIIITFLLIASCKNPDSKIKREHQLGPVPASSMPVADSTIKIFDKATRILLPGPGPFLRLKDKSIAFFDTTNHFNISDDEGKTWKQHLVVTDTSKYKMLDERAFVQLPSGILVAAFINGKEKFGEWNAETSDMPGARMPHYTMRSLDGGKTWQDFKKLHDDWTGANRKMIVTKEGNIIISSMKMAHNPGRHIIITYTSKDEGLTWTASNVLDKGGKGNHDGLTEATFAELKNGDLWMLIRTNFGQFYETISKDQGITWEDPKPSGIDASSAPAMLLRLQSGRLLLVWNREFPEAQNSYKLKGGDDQWSHVASSNHREELSAALSDDDGKTWGRPVVLAKSMREIGMDKMRNWIAYPFCFEVNPGLIWITTFQSKLKIAVKEKDLMTTEKYIKKAQ